METIDTNVVFLSDYRPRGATQGVCEDWARVRANKDFGDDGPALISDGTEGVCPSTDDMQTRYPTPTGLLEGGAEPVSESAKRVMEALKKRRATGECKSTSRPQGAGHHKLEESGVGPGGREEKVRAAAAIGKEPRRALKAKSVGTELG